MKKNILLLAAIVSAIVLQAQDASLVWSSQTMSWFGVDFTKAKVLGLEDSPHKIRDEYFKPWNDVTIDMDLTKMFGKNAVYKDPNGITKDNLARETETMNTGKEVDLTDEVIAERVKAMSTGSKKVGLGLVFIAESISKATGNAVFHIVFFDIASRKVVWHKKMTGKASGSNPKTAWGGAVKDVFSQIDKKEWKAWRKEANY